MVTWDDRPFDSLGRWPTASDPLAHHCKGLVELRLGAWWAYIPDVMDMRASSREEAKLLVETTLRMEGKL